MRKNNAIVIILITVLILLLLLGVLCYSKSFTIDEYNHRILWHKQLGYDVIQLGDGEIRNKWEALKTTRPFLEQQYNIGPCIYTVSYDADNQCWLVQGTMLEAWICNAIGGTKNIIIQSDGTVIAVWLSV